VKLVDVNVLVYAHRAEMKDHAAFRVWLEDLLNGQSAFGIAREVLSAFMRVTTHPRIFDPPTPLERAIDFANTIREAPTCVCIEPGPRHWDIFLELCRAAGAKGNLIPDAYLAALAIESGSEWVTTDRDYSRFPGLIWRHPLA
jgi:toxin-antitoxin system PIN domain toxin